MPHAGGMKLVGVVVAIVGILYWHAAVLSSADEPRSYHPAAARPDGAPKAGGTATDGEAERGVGRRLDGSSLDVAVAALD